MVAAAGAAGLAAAGVVAVAAPAGRVAAAVHLREAAPAVGAALPLRAVDRPNADNPAVTTSEPAMKDFILFMRGDVAAEGGDDGWEAYLQWLRGTGRFDGGSGIGAGRCVSRSSREQPGLSPLTGYLRVRAENLEDAVALLKGNPLYEAGGCVEVRELPRDD